MFVNYFFSRLFGTLAGIFVGFIAWLTSVLAFDLFFLIDVAVGILGFALGYIPTQRLTSRKYLQTIGLTRREYHYVQSQLNTAKFKVRRILKTFVDIRTINDFKQIRDVFLSLIHI